MGRWSRTSLAVAIAVASFVVVASANCPLDRPLWEDDLLDPDAMVGGATASNVLGRALVPCSRPNVGPVTGYFRDGCCTTGPSDTGRHVVCSRMTEEFLAFTKARGNDLSSPAPRYGFPGLRPGDFWCLCASRWREAMQAGVAPPVVLESTHRGALDYVTLEELQEHAISRDDVAA